MNKQSDNKPPFGIEFNHVAWKNALPKGISRRKIAQAIGTSDSNLIAIEKGLSKPSILLAFRYCDFVHLPVGDLCTKN